jgi:hypothetical protein
MILKEDLEKTVKILQSIVDSCVHPNVAVRAVFVELSPIRKEIIRLKKLMERNT